MVGFSYKKMSELLFGPKNSGRYNEVVNELVICRGSTVFE